MTTTETIHTLSALTPGQTLAVEAIASGATHAEAADTAGVRRETVTRWLSHSPAVREALHRLRYVTAEAVLDRHISARARALDILAEHLASVDPHSPDGFSAAIATLKVLPEVAVTRPETAEVEARKMVTHLGERLGDADLFSALMDPSGAGERLAVALATAD